MQNLSHSALNNAEFRLVGHEEATHARVNDGQNQWGTVNLDRGKVTDDFAPFETRIYKLSQPDSPVRPARPDVKKAVTTSRSADEATAFVKISGTGLSGANVFLQVRTGKNPDGSPIWGPRIAQDRVNSQGRWRFLDVPVPNKKYAVLISLEANGFTRYRKARGDARNAGNHLTYPLPQADTHRQANPLVSAVVSNGKWIGGTTHAARVASGAFKLSGFAKPYAEVSLSRGLGTRAAVAVADEYGRWE